MRTNFHSYCVHVTQVAGTQYLTVWPALVVPVRRGADSPADDKPGGLHAALDQRFDSVQIVLEAVIESDQSRFWCQVIGNTAGHVGDGSGLPPMFAEQIEMFFE